jgi:signal transduction histidine kinase
LMGGRIMLESQVGEGSTFSVLLPVIHQPAPTA